MYNQVRSFLLETTDSINDSLKKQGDEDEKNLNEEQKSFLEQFRAMKWNRKDGREEILLKLFRATFEKYITQKDGHTKDDYKDPEMSRADRKIQVLGMLCALEEEDENGNIKPPSFLKTDKNQFRRKELLTEEQYQCLSVKEQDAYRSIDLWGEPWYCDKEQNPE